MARFIDESPEYQPEDGETLATLEDEEVDKKLVATIDDEYITIEKCVKSINIALNNIISNMKKV